MAKTVSRKYLDRILKSKGFKELCSDYQESQKLNHKMLKKLMVNNYDFYVVSIKVLCFYYNIDVNNRKVAKLFRDYKHHQDSKTNIVRDITIDDVQAILNLVDKHLDIVNLVFKTIIKKHLLPTNELIVVKALYVKIFDFNKQWTKPHCFFIAFQL